MLFAAIDALMCAARLLQAERLERAAGVRREHVLQGARRGGGPARLLLAADRDRPLHGHHGRDAQLAHGQALLQGAQDGQAFSSKGRVTKDPVSGRAVDNNEPESASMGNPMYEFDFAGAWEDFIGTTGADECAKCFSCKVPELRILWWFVASIGSLVSPSNFAQYAGNVTDNCQDNGQLVHQRVRPVGRRAAPVRSVAKGGYTAGIAQIDAQHLRLVRGVDHRPERAHRRGARPHLCAVRAGGAPVAVGRPREHGGARARLHLPYLPQHAPRGRGERAHLRPARKSTRTWTPTRSRAPRRSSCTTRAAGSSTRSSRPAAGGCTTWATSSRRAARTRCGARRRRSSA